MKNNQNESLTWLYQELLAALELTPTSDRLQSSLDSESSVPRPSLESALLPEEIPDWDGDLAAADEDWPPMTSTTRGESALNPPSFAMGDLPTVQQHFQTLIRNRIRTEMHRRPPRFPWEPPSVAIEDLHYQDDFQTEVQHQQRSWLPQLSRLLPIQVPETVLLQLFAACTANVGSVHPQSRKMVDAVRSVFPDYWSTLNEVVNRIRLSPALMGARDAAQTRAEQQRLAQVLPADYEQASLEQQMAIAVILAKTLLDQLSLQLSPYRTTQSCTWSSYWGDIQVQAHLDRALATRPPSSRSTGPLTVTLVLPIGGSLTVKTPGDSSTQQLAQAGELRLTLPRVTWGQTYVLELQLHHPEASPLQLAVSCQR